MPPALRRALDLLADPPAAPDVSKGYLDLLGTAPDSTAPKNTGAIQAVWASPIGSMLYDYAQTAARRLLAVWQHPLDWLNIPPGGIALDVGSGPGTVTASLARAAGPGGLRPVTGQEQIYSMPVGDKNLVFVLYTPTLGSIARSGLLLPPVHVTLGTTNWAATFQEPSPPPWIAYPAKNRLVNAVRALRIPPAVRPAEDAKTGVASPMDGTTAAAIADGNTARVRKRPPLADL